MSKKCIVCSKVKNIIYFSPNLDVCDHCKVKVDPKMRNCLKCAQSFLSIKNNRVCPSCKRSNYNIHSPNWKPRKEKSITNN